MRPEVSEWEILSTLTKPRILSRIQETLQSQDVEGCRQEFPKIQLNPPTRKTAESLQVLCAYLEHMIQGLRDAGPPAPLIYPDDDDMINVARPEDSVCRAQVIGEEKGLFFVPATNTESAPALLCGAECPQAIAEEPKDSLVELDAPPDLFMEPNLPQCLPVELDPPPDLLEEPKESADSLVELDTPPDFFEETKDSADSLVELDTPSDFFV